MPPRIPPEVEPVRRVRAHKRSWISRPLANALWEAFHDTPVLWSKPRAICVPIGAAVLTAIFRGTHTAWDIAGFTVVSGVFSYGVALIGRMLMIPNRLGRQIETLDSEIARIKDGSRQIQKAGALRMAAREAKELHDALASKGEFNAISQAIPGLTVATLFDSKVLDHVRQDPKAIAECKLFHWQEFYEAHKQRVTEEASGIVGFNCNENINHLSRCREFSEFLEHLNKHSDALNDQASALISPFQ